MDFAALTAGMDRSVNALLGSTAVVYTPAGGASVSTTPSGAPLRGIFDSDHVHLDEGGAGVDTRGPAVSLLLADLPDDPGAVASPATLVIGGVTYRKRGIGARDANRIVLLLHRVG